MNKESEFVAEEDFDESDLSDMEACVLFINSCCCYCCYCCN